MSSIYLIRHGEVPQSSPRRFIGQRDLPLTDRGKEQMARLAPILLGHGLERVICSPLSRCVDSARIICLRLGCRPTIEHPLKEICLGDWEGLRVSDVRARYPGAYEARGRDIANFKIPRGESFADVHDRVWPLFSDIGSHGDVAIIAHAGVNRVILCSILGMPLENLFRIEQHYGCLNLIEHDRNGFRIRGINLLPHTGPVSHPAGNRVADAQTVSE